jgi:hypothetical protein
MQRTDESKQLEARLGDIWPNLVDSNTLEETTTCPEAANTVQYIALAREKQDMAPNEVAI